MWAYSLAVRIEAWHFLGGAPIWLVLFLQFRQRRLAHIERLEAEHYQRLRGEGKDTSVFESTAIESSLHLSERRLAWLEKYLLPIFALLTSGYLLGIGIWSFTALRSAVTHSFPRHEIMLGATAFLVGLALMSFLFSRYIVGMSRQAEWRPLRAGGSYLLGNALACFALAIVLLFADAGYVMGESIMAYVLVFVMLAIGVEIILNLIMDAYRPRLKDRYHRAAYESRLLGLFSEPGGLLRTAAHAMDYQFGFKVSETWFYKLLERAVLPLIVIQVGILYLMSCIAIVEPGHLAVVERWGKPLNIAQPLQGGLHFKLPWPIDQLRSFPTEQLQTIEVGFIRHLEDQEEENLKPILWTQPHWAAELPYMVAVSDSQGSQPIQQDSSDVRMGRNSFDLLILGLNVHYRISDIAQYGYGKDRCYLDPHALLKSICYRQALHYCARSDMDALLGPGRKLTTDTLHEAIQKKVDQEQMGIKIVFVGMEAVHPHVDVAESFEKVVSALQDKQATVLKAMGQEQVILAKARGQSDVLVSQARADAYARVVLTKAKAARFSKQIEAYEQGQDIYLLREYLAVLEEFLPQMRKYVFAFTDVKSLIYEVDLTENLQPDLFEGLEIPTPQQESSN